MAGLRSVLQVLEDLVKAKMISPPMYLFRLMIMMRASKLRYYIDLNAEM
jgi:hypothetical protein